MAEVWPVSLPQRFLKANYQDSFADNLLRSNTDQGPAKVRRRSTSNARAMSGDMFLTTTQLATLETFWNTTTLGGSLALTFPDPRGGSALLVRFTGPPKWGNIGGAHWQVSLAFEVLP